MLLKELCDKCNINCPAKIKELPFYDRWINSVYGGEQEKGVHKWHVEYLSHYDTFCFNSKGDYRFSWFSY